MFKTEVICDTCESQYIIVTRSNDQAATFCPFCSSSIALEEEDDDDLDIDEEY